VLLSRSTLILVTIQAQMTMKDVWLLPSLDSVVVVRLILDNENAVYSFLNYVS
jgi:hypothetical protein